MKNCDFHGFSIVMLVYWRVSSTPHTHPLAPRLDRPGADPHGTMAWALLPSGDHGMFAMERSTIFHGKIHYFDWAMFNCYVSLTEGKTKQTPRPQDFTGLHRKIHGDDVFFGSSEKGCLDQKIRCGIRSLHHQVRLGT